MILDQQLLMKVDFAFCYLAQRARTERRWLRRPLEGLAWNLHHKSHVLEALGIDTMDLWIAYHLLGRREQSRSGRSSCAWLAEQLQQALRAEHDCYRGKTGALMLWSLLARLYRKREQTHMYRIATGLIAAGRDHFLLSPDGPFQVAARPDPIAGDRDQEVRLETRAYYTGDRERDLRPFTGVERIIGEQEWRQVHQRWRELQRVKSDPGEDEAPAAAPPALPGSAAERDEIPAPRGTA